MGPEALTLSSDFAPCDLPFERQALSESWTETRIMLNRVEQQLREAREAREDDQECHDREIKKIEKAARVTRLQHNQAMETAQRQHTRLLEELEATEAECAQLGHKVDDLLREKEAAKPSQSTFSLDAFDNTLDQVSEADVKSNGHPSIDGLNDSIDNMVQDIVDQALEQSETYTADRSALLEQRRTTVKGSREPFLIALAKSGLTEENRGLLMDAVIHHVVVRELCQLFFCGEAVTFTMAKTSILDELFEVISADCA